MEYREMKEVNAPNCGRENDLIAFLYGELSDVEARTFQHHMHDCPGCSAELETFKDIRESVVNWRNESLGLISESPANDWPAACGPQRIRQRSEGATSAFKE